MVFGLKGLVSSSLSFAPSYASWPLQSTALFPSSSSSRPFSAQAAAAAPTPERRMEEVLKERLAASHVEVKDVSGGCGAFYTVIVVSPQFTGLTPLKQHRLVNEALEKDIGKMHGLTLRTFSPEGWAKQVAAAK